MSVLHIDIEGGAERDLKKRGVYVYSEDPRARIWCMCYRFDDEPVQVWVPSRWLTPEFEWYLEQYVLPGLEARSPGGQLHLGPLPQRVQDHFKSGGEVRAFGAMFERTMINSHSGQTLDMPPLSIYQTVCVKAKCAASGIPQKLEKAAKALGTHLKDTQGAAAMHYFAKPRRLPSKRGQPKVYDFAIPAEHPERFVELLLYCVDDVLSECGVDEVLQDISPREQETYFLDQRMNDRGWAVDLVTVANIKEVIRQYRDEMTRRCTDMTCTTHKCDHTTKACTGLRPTQIQAIKKWVHANGYSQLKDMKAMTVIQAVLDPTCPPAVKELLQLFSTFNMKAVSKYDAMERCVCADGRVHGMFTYHGASPGRWTAQLVQLQNLLRPLIKDAETAVEAFRARDLGWIRDLYSGLRADGTRGPNPMLVAASTVRSCLVAGPGCDLVFPDFSGVEARGIAWLFDEESELEIFRKQDNKTGPDAYRMTFGKSFGIKPEVVTSFQRQIGKVMKLSLGSYQGGPGAFVNMVPNYKINLEELTEAVWPQLTPDVIREAQDNWLEAVHGRRTLGLSERTYMACDALKILTRRTIPGIVNGWYSMEREAIAAVEQPGTVTQIESGKAMFKLEGSWPHQWLVMRLPSGRRIKYYQPIIKQSVRKNRHGESKVRKVLTFMRTEKIWKRISTYGGKLSQNWNEGHCRDLLVAAKFRLEKAGYLPVGTIHDEPITEIAIGKGSWEEAKELMLQVPKFSAGMPIAVEGRRSPRYGK